LKMLEEGAWGRDLSKVSLPTGAAKPSLWNLTLVIRPGR
jgi:hypothetical protein